MANPAFSLPRGWKGGYLTNGLRVLKPPAGMFDSGLPWDKWDRQHNVKVRRDEAVLQFIFVLSTVFIRFTYTTLNSVTIMVQPAGDGVALFYASILLVALSWITYITRVGVRIWRKAFGSDDYIMGVGLVRVHQLTSCPFSQNQRANSITGSLHHHMQPMHHLLLARIRPTCRGPGSHGNHERSQGTDIFSPSFLSKYYHVETN
jgi:hypothetical protein